MNYSKEKGGGKFIVIEYGFPWPPYNLEEGWRGALCQAGFLKTLLLAYETTGNRSYLEAGDRVLGAFEADIKDGGFKTYRKDGNESYLWFPEYVTSNPPYVLNGYITTLIWIREYGTATSNARAMSLYLEGVKSLAHFLPQYDCGKGCSYYDARGKLASEKYHRLHIKQTEWMYEITNETIFLKYHRRWEK